MVRIDRFKHRIPEPALVAAGVVDPAGFEPVRVSARASDWNVLMTGKET